MERILSARDHSCSPLCLWPGPPWWPTRRIAIATTPTPTTGGDGGYAIPYQETDTRGEPGRHSPVLVLAHPADLTAQPGMTVKFSAAGTTDPDGDELTFRWWQDPDALTCRGDFEIVNAGKPQASFTVPGDRTRGQTINIICEMTDNGTPPLTRYQRLVGKI